MHATVEWLSVVGPLVLSPEITVGGLFTGLSVVVAFVLGVVGYLWSRKSTIRTHTIDLLVNLSTNERLAEANFEMTRLINEGVAIDGYSIDDETDRYVIDILNYYEFLATAWDMDALNDEALLHIRGGAMSRAFDVSETYIVDRRESLDAPELYGKFETFVREYRRRTPDSA